MLKIEQIKEIVSRIGKKYGIKNAYLFGSYARGEQTETSDIDIIIDRGELSTYDDYFDMREELSRDLNVKVDLVATDGVKPNFYKLIKDDRILLYGA